MTIEDNTPAPEPEDKVKAMVVAAMNGATKEQLDQMAADLTDEERMKFLDDLMTLTGSDGSPAQRVEGPPEEGTSAPTAEAPEAQPKPAKPKPKKKRVHIPLPKPVVAPQLAVPDKTSLPVEKVVPSDIKEVVDSPPGTDANPADEVPSPLPPRKERMDTPAEEPEFVKKMSPAEKSAYLRGKLESAREGSRGKPMRASMSGSIKEQDDLRNARRELKEDFENTRDQEERQREPAMIEAEAVAKIAKAMHHPDRMEALLHSHIPEKILSNMGELEAIERDSKALYIGQVEDLVAMEGRFTRALLALKIVDSNDRWDKEEFLDILEELTPEDKSEVEDYAKIQIEDFQRQAELVDENWLWLEGIMKGVDDAFELALSAADKGRAEHGVKNISSMVQGAAGRVDFEAEASRSLWRRLKERFAVDR